MRRRKFLASAAATGTAASAGCLSVFDSNGNGGEDPTVEGTVVEGPDNVGSLDKYSRITDFGFEEVNFEIKSDDHSIDGTDSEFRVVIYFSDYPNYSDPHLVLASEPVELSDGEDTEVTIPLVEDVSEVEDDTRITEADEVRGEVRWLERVPRAKQLFGHAYIDPVGQEDPIYLHETERFRTDHEVVAIDDHPLSLEDTELDNFERYNVSGAFLVYFSAVTRSGLDWAQEFRFPKARFISAVETEWDGYQSAARQGTIGSNTPLYTGVEDVIDAADIDDSVQDDTVTRAEIALSMARGLPQSSEMEFPSEWEIESGFRIPQEVVLNGGPRQSGDAAVLFTACVAPAENQRAAIVKYPRDMAAAVTGDFSGGSTYTIDGETFHYIHLSSELEIGEEPPVSHEPELLEI